jgi:hypothetical protein
MNLIYDWLIESTNQSFLLIKVSFLSNRNDLLLYKYPMRIDLKMNI